MQYESRMVPPGAVHLAAQTAQPPPVQPRHQSQGLTTSRSSGALNKASHIALSGVPPVLAYYCSLCSAAIASISCATALSIFSFLWLLLSQVSASKCFSYSLVQLHFLLFLFCATALKFWSMSECSVEIYFFSLCKCTFQLLLLWLLTRMSEILAPGEPSP